MDSLDGHRIACRYFPNSFRQYQLENPTPAKIFDGDSELICECCVKNLLLESEHLNYVLLKEEDFENGSYQERYKDMYFACRGNCDKTIKRLYQEKGLYDSEWDSIDELCNPSIWISKIMAFLNGIQHKHNLDNIAFEKMKKLFINTYPYVARHLTQKERERVKTLLMYGLM